MSRAKIHVALEIGTSKVCMLVGEVKSDASVKILGIGTSKTAGVRKGEIVDFQNASKCVHDALADADAGPVVVVLPSTQTVNTVTPKGRTVIVCPATQRDNVSCATCQLCQRQRAAIVGFPAHGTRKRVIDIKLAA